MASSTQCTSCGRLNPGEASFCNGCGAPLGLLCAGCGRINPPGSVFCMGCGHRLAEGDGTSAEEQPRSGERRHLTVMFSDLVDSTRLAGELDPEDMRDLLVAYHDACSEAISDNAGFVAQFLGDGVLAYFGYPEAHEDDARLAIYAGISIIEAMQGLCHRFHRTDVDARVGIHTGEVVVVAEERQDHEIVGETPNIAARLQAVAGPGSVVISDQTRELVQGYFALHPMGALDLKGVARQVPGFKVIGRTEARNRFDTIADRGLTPLVGRAADLDELSRHWEAVRDGTGRVVLLSGEPGIGKSRLAHELCLRVAQAGSPTLRLRCSPYNTGSPLYPIIDHLLQVVGGEHDDGGEPSGVLDRLDRLEAHLEAHGIDPKAGGPPIAEFLAIPTGDRYPSTSDSAERRKRRMLEILFAWLLAHSNTGPMVLLVEDIQWMDPTTLELFSRYFGADPVADALLLLTHRTDFVPPWSHRAHLHHMVLERLGADDITALLRELTGGRAMPDELEAVIAARTDGVPLFVEEVTHAVLESGYVEEQAGALVSAATVPERMVPATLRESLMARLDRLGEAREVAQMLSVIGREATFELLRSVSMLDDHELESGLDRLIETDLVRRRHTPAGATYGLKHWLVQDVAYESLLRSSRRQFHERTAAALPRELPEVVETQPEFLAHHLIEAGERREAISYLLRAGELAHRRSANTEAIEHLTRGLELVRSLPESLDRQQLELTLLISLGAPLTASKGYSAPEVEHNYSRAGELCRATGDDETSHFFRALYGTWRVHLLRADYARALEFGHQLLRLADTSGNGTQLGAAHRAVGSTLYYLGDDPAIASGHLELVISSQALERDRTSFIDELHDVVDPWITCHAYQSWTMWLTGRSAEAQRLSDRTLELSIELQHPFTRALALSFGSWLCQWTGDIEAVQRLAGEALAISRDQGFAFWIGWDEIMLGWAQAALGDKQTGLETMAHGLSGWHAVGSELGTTYFLTLMAEAQRDAGQLDEAWRSLDAAEEVAERTREGWWSPEVRRLRGELLWLSGSPIEEAEHQLTLAHELAQRRSVAALALRAAVTLAELRRGQGRDDEARTLLHSALAPFADGRADREAFVSRARSLLESVPSA